MTTLEYMRPTDLPVTLVFLSLPYDDKTSWTPCFLSMVTFFFNTQSPFFFNHLERFILGSVCTGLLSTGVFYKLYRGLRHRYDEPLLQRDRPRSDVSDPLHRYNNFTHLWLRFNVPFVSSSLFNGLVYSVHLKVFNYDFFVNL